jgi:hypothetical protein
MTIFSTKFLGALLAAALIGLGGSAQAHTDDWFDTHATPHGGQVRMAGPYHLELMPQQSGEVLVYVTDHGDTAIPTAGWTAQVVSLSGGKKTRIALKPAGANTLRGKGSVPAGAQLVLSVVPKAGEEYSARFELAPAAQKPAKP